MYMQFCKFLPLMESLKYETRTNQTKMYSNQMDFRFSWQSMSKLVSWHQVFSRRKPTYSAERFSTPMNNARPNVASLGLWVRTLDSYTRQGCINTLQWLMPVAGRNQSTNILSKHPVSSKEEKPDFSINVFVPFLDAHRLVISNPSEKDLSPCGASSTNQLPANPKQAWFTGIPPILQHCKLHD